MSAASDVRDNAAGHRYELDLDGHIAFLQYADRPDGRRVLVHTEVPSALEGEGIGSRLVKFALEDAKAHDRRIVPVCPFVRSYMDRHPEYAALAAGPGGTATN